MSIPAPAVRGPAIHRRASKRARTRYTRCAARGAGYMFDPGNHEHTWDVSDLTNNGALAHKTCITNAFNHDAQVSPLPPLQASRLLTLRANVPLGKSKLL